MGVVTNGFRRTAHGVKFPLTPLCAAVTTKTEQIMF